MDTDTTPTGTDLGGQGGSALRTARAQLAAIVESSDDAIIGKTPEGIVTSWNAGAERLYGYAAAEVIGRNIAFLVPPESPNELPDILARLARAERVPRYETTRVRKDGTRVDVAVAISPIADEAGHVVGAASIAHDISAQRQALHALRAREAQLAEAQRIAHLGSWTWDLGADVLTWSDEHYRIFGLEPDGMPITSGEAFRHIHPDDLAGTLAAVEHATAEQGSYARDVRVLRPDGSERWLHSRGTYIVGGEGHPGYLVGTAQDITERERVVEALRASEERYRSLFEFNPYAVFAFDVRGQVTTVNPAAERLSGYTTAELIGRNFLAVPEDAERAAASFAQALAGVPQSVDLAILHKSGRRLELVVTLMAIPAAGTLVGVFGMAADVTARRVTETALRESEERLRLALEIGGLARWTLDVTRQTLEWSEEAERVVGVAPGSFDGSLAAFQALIHPDDRARVNQEIDTTLATRTEYRLDFRIVRMDGTTRWFANSARVYRDHDGQPLRLVGVARDITDQKDAEHQREALVQAEKLRAVGQMASGVAHNLNQSLALIAGYGDLASLAAAAAPFGETPIPEYLHVITQAALDGGETVKRLLMFARLRPEGPRERVELGHLLHEVAALTAPRWRDASQAEGRPIGLQVEAEGAHVIEGWPHSLREALTNLIFNAVDALPSGGSIHLGVHRADGDEVLEVTDSGTGMSPDVQAKIFEPFFTTKGENGTGLGLASVFGLVEAHGGSITLESSLGHGSTFRLAFPAPVVATGSETATATSVRTRPLHLLAVDDQPALCRLVKLMLETDGHTVDMAASGEDALRMLRSMRFDLVISDVGMGTGMNGWELASHVRAVHPGLPFVLATGWGSQIDPVDARLKGVQKVIVKPYRLDDLRRVVAALCGPLVTDH